MFSLLSIPSAVCAMARYYQLIIFTGMKYQYQAVLPLPALCSHSANDQKMIFNHLIGMSMREEDQRYLQKNMQYIDWIMDVF